MQNFRAKPDTAMRHTDDLDLDEYRATIAVTRLVLGPQGPGPGTAEPRRPGRVPGPARGRRRRLRRGLPADPRPREPRTPLAVPRPAARPHHRSCGFELRPRLTVHPEYVRQGEPWLDPRISAHVAALAADDGLARPGVRPGRPALAGTRRRLRLRRHRPHRPAPAVDTEGRTADRRSDFAGVYGDWDDVARGRRPHHRGVLGADTAARRGSRPPSRAAERDPATCPTSTP